MNTDGQVKALCLILGWSIILGGPLFSRVPRKDLSSDGKLLTLIWSTLVGIAFLISWR